jgi:hypothetical protein
MNAPDWPSGEARGFLIGVAQAEKNWGLLAETLWDKWSKTYLTALGQLRTDFSYLPQEYVEKMKQTFRDGTWKNDIKPLLESLIRANRVGDAETVILDLARFPDYKGFQQMAAELALSCGNKRLQTKWLTLEIPSVSLSDEELLSLEIKLSFHNRLSAILIVINGEQFEEQINSILEQGRMLTWSIENVQVEPALSEALRKREGWAEGEIHWGLFDANAKMFASGQGFPSEEILYRALEASLIPSPVEILRSFVNKHPNHYSAKMDLLSFQKWLSENKTKEKLGKDADKNLKLSEEDDQAIWGEYALLFQKVLNYSLEQGRPEMVIYGPCRSDYFIYSPKMMRLIRSILPKIEAALKRQPTDFSLWQWWLDFAGLLEYRHFTELKDTLLLPPMDDHLELLPDAVTRIVTLLNYENRADWLGIIDLQKWRWEAIQGSPKLDKWLGASWQTDWKPLLEAYLRIERYKEANELVKISSQSKEWNETNKKIAVDVAKKCGKTALAEQWENLN